MVLRIFLLFFLFQIPTARALITSERALRIEDSREGNLLLGAEKAVLERGEIYKRIILVWGNLEISGEVDQIIVLSGHVSFRKGAKLNKSILIMGGSFESEPGAEVNAESVVAQVPGPAWRVIRSLGLAWRDNMSWISRLIGGLVASLFFWLSGWALFALFPGVQRATAGELGKEWGKNLLVGLLASIFACAIFAALVISIFGILLIPIYLLLLILSAWISYSAAALWAGHRLMPPRKEKKIQPWGFLLGCLAFQFLWATSIWWAALPVLVLWTLSWGALIRSLRRLWR